MERSEYLLTLKRKQDGEKLGAMGPKKGKRGSQALRVNFSSLDRRHPEC
jgi:hypothetical protein